ncbi:hypothetical protein UA08_08454 [Talaromyces atroroseus]|uniref:Enoyl reductase (ER) domain-containing protein n=1 Tax=Talaromyces atroroseus TaxID=1441469 RepID=A0A1Q5Q7G7_TALAT|nr:hypothetical protein UA08_08454 [Talaromyces atroroseus]OKL56158.1 hypothetical protein UA08_08454 [Talaromyces atroroseus]
MAAVPELFTGYGAKSAEKWTNLEKFQFKPKTFEEFDVDIKIDFCGICGSDLHTLSGGWGGTLYPSVVGHEIVGKVARVGAKVTSLNVGDIVGVGANAWSCGDCRYCKKDLEQYCPNLIETYNFTYSDGTRSWGGYADYVRVNERFVFPVPKSLDPAVVGPLFCAGLTVFSPLIRNNVTKGSRVGIIGIGGLGHLAIQFSVALGAEVSAISHSSRKKEDALKMGVTNFVTLDTLPEHKRSLDLIVCTSFSKEMPLAEYLKLLDVGGTLVYVGIPEADLPSLPPTLMIGTNAALRGSNTGSKKEVLQMLDLVEKHDIKPWVELLPMSECSEAVQKQLRGEARYRYVLKNDGTFD